MKTGTGPLPVLEISAGMVMAYDPVSQRSISGESVSSVMAQIGAREVNLSLSRRSAFIRAVRLPDASRQDLERILTVQISQFLPTGVGELAYSFRLTPEKTAEGRLVVIGAVKSDLLRSALSQIRASGGKVGSVIPAAFGSWALARQMGIESCAIVEETAEGLAIDLVVDGELRYSRVTPMPGSQAELAAEVSRTSSAAEVGDLPVLAVGQLAYDGATYRSELGTRAALPGSIVEAGISIEPPEARMERARKSIAIKARLTAMVGAASAAVLATAYLDYSDAVRKADLVERSWNSKITKASREQKNVEAKLAGQTSMREQLTLAFEPAQRFSDMLSVAGNLAPDGIWLTGVAAERGQPLSLRGTARRSEDVAAYMERLSAMSRFRNVDLSVANNGMIEETPVVQFALSAHPVGNLPLIEQGRSAKK